MIKGAGWEVLGWGGGEQLVARIRPGGLPDNDPTWTYMTVLFNSGAIHFKFQPDPGNWFAVTTTSMFRLAFEYESLMRITDVYPAVIENTTDFIFIEAEIDGFEAHPGLGRPPGPSLGGATLRPTRATHHFTAGCAPDGPRWPTSRC